jgi:hypothetical protein
MNEINWQEVADEYMKKFFHLKDALEDIITATSNEKPFDNPSWYKRVAKRALDTCYENQKNLDTSS